MKDRSEEILKFLLERFPREDIEQFRKNGARTSINRKAIEAEIKDYIIKHKGFTIKELKDAGIIEDIKVVDEESKKRATAQRTAIYRYRKKEKMVQKADGVWVLPDNLKSIKEWITKRITKPDGTLKKRIDLTKCPTFVLGDWEKTKRIFKKEGYDHDGGRIFKRRKKNE